MPDLLGIGKLLFQLGDYAVKAVVHFANTDEGEKEWGDVVSAFVALDLFNPADAAQGVTVTPTEGGHEFTLADIERLSETFDKPAEQGRVTRPAVRNNRRSPAKTPNVDDIPF